MTSPFATAGRKISDVQLQHPAHLDRLRAEAERAAHRDHGDQPDPLCAICRYVAAQIAAGVS